MCQAAVSSVRFVRPSVGREMNVNTVFTVKQSAAVSYGIFPPLIQKEVWSGSVLPAQVQQHGHSQFLPSVGSGFNMRMLRSRFSNSGHSGQGAKEYH